MKDSRPHSIDRRRFTNQLPAVSTETSVNTDPLDVLSDPQCQGHYITEEALLHVRASTFTGVPQDYGQSRIVRERDDRTTLEDKIRRAVDGWTAEERATAYWYLYACGMTLDRAKAIRHKGGFNA